MNMMVLNQYMKNIEVGEKMKVKATCYKRIKGQPTIIRVFEGNQDKVLKKVNDFFFKYPFWDFKIKWDFEVK